MKANPSENDFAQEIVGKADNLNFCDLRMRIQEVFDLAWKNVLSAPNDHVLRTSG